jgi:hypothetical protein
MSLPIPILYNALFHVFGIIDYLPFFIEMAIQYMPWVIYIADGELVFYAFLFKG